MSGCAAFFAASLPAQGVDTRTDTARVVHLLERATFGPTPHSLERALELGVEGWLDRQLQPDRIGDDEARQRLSAIPAAGMSVEELYRSFPSLGTVRKILRLEMGDPARAPKAERARADSAFRAEARRRYLHRDTWTLRSQLIEAKLVRAVHSRRQLEEVMTDFWFNHFNVDFNKGAGRWLAVDFERNAIRPHVFGRFEELLVAVARHPGMLYYLDNWRSTARQPDGPDAGLNENFARELLELHTVGVEAGYTQEDVRQVALAFTGWTIVPPNPWLLGDSLPDRYRLLLERDIEARRWEGEPVAFYFSGKRHDDRPRIIMGHHLPAGGEEQGLAVLEMLARHPATAHRMALKLARHFVADDPPASLVDRLAGVFGETNGDLAAVTRALFTAPEFFDPAYRGAKIKTPFRLLASTLRAADGTIESGRGATRALLQLEQLPYHSAPPTGYSTLAEDLLGSGAMVNRMKLGMALATAELDGVRVHPAALGPPDAGDTAALADAILERLLPAGDVDRLRETILESVPHADRRRTAPRVLALVLASPQFQRH